MDWFTVLCIIYKKRRSRGRSSGLLAADFKLFEFLCCLTDGSIVLRNIHCEWKIVSVFSSGEADHQMQCYPDRMRYCR